MVFVGIQASVYSGAIDAAERTIVGQFQTDRGPRFWDRAEFVDAAGYFNVVIACYWDNRTDYRIWLSERSYDWWHEGHAIDGDIGFFLEAFTPGIEDTETTFSHPYPEGYAHIASAFSGKTDTHGYWGSARERIPRSQVDPLEPEAIRVASDLPRGQESRGQLVHVEPHDNLFLLRSGQDWADSDTAEREFYIADVQPVLERGMTELSGNEAPSSCYFNRYVAVAAQHGEDSRRTYSLSAWRSLADLEAWCRADGHLAIFAAGTQHYRRVGEAAKLRLYHEGTVIRAGDQYLAYFNCHPTTGMLRAL